MSDARGKLFVMVGPGGTGKNTLMNIMMEQYPQITQLATATTRPMRPTEQQHREHIFVSLERFREMIANDELLEFQEVTPGKFYGIPRQSVDDALDNGRYLIADIEVLGAKIVRETYGEDDVLLIFVTVPGETTADKLSIMRERMMQRIVGDPSDDDLQVIEQRLERARTVELPFAETCDIVVENQDLDKAAATVERFIISQLDLQHAQTEES